MRLEGKKAIITGAAQGLGRAIALDFAAEGAEMLLADIQAEKAAQVAALIGENGGRAEVMEVDVTDAAQVEAMVQRAIALFGNVDILVNDAGGSGTVGVQHIEDVTEEILTLAEALNIAEENQQSLADTMLAFADPVFNATSAIGDLVEAEANLVEVSEDVESSARDIAEAELEVFEATLKAQGALDKFSGANLDEQLKIIQTTTGKTKDEALAFLEALGLIDGKKVRSVIDLEIKIRESVIRIAR